MSNELRKYLDDTAFEYEGFGDKSNQFSVTAFMGQDKYGSGVQFTLKNEHFKMSDDQIEDLIEILQKRIDGVDGYKSTCVENNFKEITRTGEEL